MQQQMAQNPEMMQNMMSRTSACYSSTGLSDRFRDAVRAMSWVYVSQADGSHAKEAVYLRSTRYIKRQPMQVEPDGAADDAADGAEPGDDAAGDPEQPDAPADGAEQPAGTQGLQVVCLND